MTRVLSSASLCAPALVGGEDRKRTDDVFGRAARRAARPGATEMRVQHMHVALRVGVLSMLAREPTPPRDLGRRRLVTRGEIKRVAMPNQGKIAQLIDTRVRSALEGRVLLGEQPPDYRTGLSTADEQTLIDCVERHFSFAPLDQMAETALAIEVDQIGVTLEQGLGVRNQLYRARHEIFRGGLPREILPTSWDQLPQACTDADRLAHAPTVC